MWLRRKRPEVKSQEAVKESLKALKKTEQRNVAVEEVAESLRALRERNHFAEQLAAIMGGPR